MKPLIRSGIGIQAIQCKSQFLAILFAMFALSPLCLAQNQAGDLQPQAEQPVKTISIDSAIEVARADMSAEKRATISAWMEFNDKDGSAFWPVYRKYEYERAALDDLRVVVIKEYTEKYESMTDADSKAMTERMFEYDAREIELKRKYFKEFNKVLPALTVAKFFQLEHRIDLLMGIKVESSLPPLNHPESPEQ